MPVPVHVFPKQPAHPVIKINHPGQPDSEPSVFQHLTHSLPLPPQGPPPSLASREEWISSLPSWRRNKPRRIWEDESGRHQDYTTQGFDEGLAVADNAIVIKGTPAQASFPPIRAATRVVRSREDMYPVPEVEMDDEMGGYNTTGQEWDVDEDAYVEDYSPVDSMSSDRQPAESPSDAPMDYVVSRSAYHRGYPSASAGGYERGAFSPVQEDLSPDTYGRISPDPARDPEPGSSPVGPATPFADFIDNAFTQAQVGPPMDHSRNVQAVQPPHYVNHDGYHAACYQCQTYQVEQPAQQAPVADAVVTPMATAAYKKLAAPLSEWIANYVWKVCTTGMRLPAEYAQPNAFVKHYPTSPPSHLASSIHSMLLSTLLQPSAIFLAMWYIVRLPVFFGPVGLTPEHSKEIDFRAELLGEAHLGIDREMIEAYAPFRLVLLGCMLANKWLDDHTFSNKTWHTISNIPVRSLNKLEALALDIFQYDLSVTPQQWSNWLSELLGYHASLSSPMFPQPISRPSTSPHVIVRQAIEMLVNAQDTENVPEVAASNVLPRPIFVSLEEPKQGKVDIHDIYTDDVLEIDLDEDGPLREEYLPRRRHNSKPSYVVDLPLRSDRVLPPPARWSPSADEPIMRDPTRNHGQYVAPQPMAQLTMAPPSQTYHRSMDLSSSSWITGGYAPRQEPIGRPHVFAPPPAIFHAPAAGFEYSYALPAHHGHSRSHSLSYGQAIGEQIPGRVRSFSQTQYDRAYGENHFSEARYLPPPPVTSQWTTSYDRIGFPTSYDRPFGLQNRPSLKA
ncbi:hypothetical protein C8Q78DRAFT_70737 [Trametes maxima]|nr:hypothetical protein C8Q78DRAFT_70737 [Trametes maxima]